MRIAFIHPSWPGGEGTGATHTATQMVDGLASRGHELRVYCTSEPPADVPLSEKPYEIQVLEEGVVPHTNTRLNRAVKNLTDELAGFDVVHSYMPPLVPAIGHVGEQTSACTAVTLNAYRGVCAKNDLRYLDREQCQDNTLSRCVRCTLQTSPGSDEFSAPYRFISRLGDLRLVKRGARRVDAIDAFRAPSTHVKSNYVALGYPADPIHVIPHPIDERFDIEHRSDFTEPYRLLFVGYLERHKGVELLLPLVAALAETDVEFSLTIVGSGGLEETLHSQATEWGVEDIVDFTGFVPYEELPELYASHDCLVYPGLWEEPLARVYLEALATGTPIVTSEYGSIGEIVGDAGQLTDGTVQNFRDTLLEVTAGETLVEMSDATTEQASQFERSRVLDEQEAMYERMLAGNHI